MFSKWIIDLPGFELYVFGEDKKLYKLPHQIGLRSFGIREIKKAKDRNRYRINGQWWSENQLRPHIKPAPESKELFINNDMPFSVKF